MMMHIYTLHCMFTRRPCELSFGTGPIGPDRKDSKDNS